MSFAGSGYCSQIFCQLLNTQVLNNWQHLSTRRYFLRDKQVLNYHCLHFMQSYFSKTNLLDDFYSPVETSCESQVKAAIVTALCATETAKLIWCLKCTFLHKRLWIHVSNVLFSPSRLVRPDSSSLAEIARSVSGLENNFDNMAWCTFSVVFPLLYESRWIGIPSVSIIQERRSENFVLVFIPFIPRREAAHVDSHGRIVFWWKIAAKISVQISGEATMKARRAVGIFVGRKTTAITKMVTTLRI